jgi:hypothetical protein
MLNFWRKWHIGRKSGWPPPGRPETRQLPWRLEKRAKNGQMRIVDAGNAVVATLGNMSREDAERIVAEINGA